MIRNPTRRLWLYADSGALEILVLGNDEDVAPMFARVRQAADAWRGFERVDAIVQGSAVLGVRVTLSPHARHLDPIAEGLDALSSAVPLSLEWHDVAYSSGTKGMVGTW